MLNITICIYFDFYSRIYLYNLPSYHHLQCLNSIQSIQPTKSIFCLFLRPRADVLEVRRRYTNLYIPSDFFFTHFRWVDAFPPDKQFTLNKPCQFHIMNKEVDPVNENNAVLEPADADYVFSAKVCICIYHTQEVEYHSFRMF